MSDSRITYNPEQCGGKPCIRGMRIRVSDVLDLYAAGLSPDQIVAELPDLEPEDLQAALTYAAR
jgi:uncharacterized protein (DUF433 family)